MRWRDLTSRLKRADIFGWLLALLSLAAIYRILIYLKKFSGLTLENAFSGGDNIKSISLPMYHPALLTQVAALYAFGCILFYLLFSRKGIIYPLFPNRWLLLNILDTIGLPLTVVSAVLAAVGAIAQDYEISKAFAIARMQQSSFKAEIESDALWRGCAKYQADLPKYFSLTTGDFDITAFGALCSHRSWLLEGSYSDPPREIIDICRRLVPNKGVESNEPKYVYGFELEILPGHEKFFETPAFPSQSAIPRRIAENLRNARSLCRTQLFALNRKRMLEFLKEKSLQIQRFGNMPWFWIGIISLVVSLRTVRSILEVWGREDRG